MLAVGAMLQTSLFRKYHLLQKIPVGQKHRSKTRTGAPVLRARPLLCGLWVFIGQAVAQWLSRLRYTCRNGVAPGGKVIAPAGGSGPCDARTLAYNGVTGLSRCRQGVLLMWTKPTYTDLRIGFEVTMYFASR